MPKTAAQAEIKCGLHQLLLWGSWPSSASRRNNSIQSHQIPSKPCIWPAEHPRVFSEIKQQHCQNNLCKPHFSAAADFLSKIRRFIVTTGLVALLEALLRATTTPELPTAVVRGSLAVLAGPVLCQEIIKCVLTLNVVKLLFYINKYAGTSRFRVRCDSLTTPPPPQSRQGPT